MFTTLLEKAVNKKVSLYITAISLLVLVVSQREKLFILQAQHWHKRLAQLPQHDHLRTHSLQNQWLCYM